MFFTISKKSKHNLKHNTVIGEWTISTDDGWQIDKHHKEIHFSKGLGSVDCTIKCNGRDWEVTTKGLRRFPLWKTEDSVSNIDVSLDKLHNPCTVRYRNGGLHVDRRPRPQWLVPSKGNILPRHQIQQQLCDILVKQAKELRDHSLPILAPNTKGVDCALVRAVLDYSGIKYKSTNISKHKLDKSHLDDENFWGYRQMLDEGLPHIQATGYNGDAYMSRQPIYVSLYLRKWGIDLATEFDKAGATYMRNSFDRHYREQLATYEFPDDPDAQLVDMLINDLQVWHIDRCLTWTPLADVDLLKTCLSIDPDTAVDQCLNAGLSRSLIKILSPARLDEIQINHNGRLPVG